MQAEKKKKSEISGYFLRAKDNKEVAKRQLMSICRGILAGKMLQGVYISKVTEKKRGQDNLLQRRKNDIRGESQHKKKTAGKYKLCRFKCSAPRISTFPSVNEKKTTRLEKSPPKIKNQRTLGSGENKRSKLTFRRVIRVRLGSKYYIEKGGKRRSLVTVIDANYKRAHKKRSPNAHVTVYSPTTNTIFQIRRDALFLAITSPPAPCGGRKR